MFRPFTSHFGILGLTIALVAASGCGGGEADGRQSVYGKVTLNGKPLEKGVIAFDPAPGGGATLTAGGVIIDGAYSIDRESGPTAGKYRVSIRSGGGESAAAKAAPGAPPSLKGAKGDPIPKEYNAESKLTADIGSSGSTEANFDLISK
jgi:hypothetical protein